MTFVSNQRSHGEDQPRQQDDSVAKALGARG